MVPAGLASSGKYWRRICSLPLSYLPVLLAIFGISWHEDDLIQSLPSASLLAPTLSSSFMDTCRFILEPLSWSKTISFWDPSFNYICRHYFLNKVVFTGTRFQELDISLLRSHTQSTKLVPKYDANIILSPISLFIYSYLKDEGKKSNLHFFKNFFLSGIHCFFLNWKSPQFITRNNWKHIYVHGIFNRQKPPNHSYRILHICSVLFLSCMQFIPKVVGLLRILNKQVFQIVSIINFKTNHLG